MAFYKNLMLIYKAFNILNLVQCLASVFLRYASYKKNLLGDAMKIRTYILTIGLLTLFSCSQNERSLKEHYVESHPSFFQLKHGKWISNEWIRKPENLKMIHETFKKFGYLNLIEVHLNSNPLVLQDIYINTEPYNLIDSLILAFENKDLEVKYYPEFWSRREKEKNDSVVYDILKDIKSSYVTFLPPEVMSNQADGQFVNDTLLQLLKIEFPKQPVTTEQAIEHFEKLRELGFHESAFNLLYQRSEYSEINWDKEELKKKLKTTENYVYPWFEDNEK